ncbi:hypothetical protein HMPREF9946_05102 [Acetobacteraceae bacterium AT-5844]|nr:hypothetical protein HMPREF9946_05102 [Acetobacteraceae bacterium AT-5844]
MTPDQRSQKSKRPRALSPQSPRVQDPRRTQPAAKGCRPTGAPENSKKEKKGGSGGIHSPRLTREQAA